MRSSIRAVCFLLAAILEAQTAIPLDWRAALNRVRADSLKGHISFLASDALEGRDTPSRGLEVAAEYISSWFRRAGLEPAGNNGYFHDTPYVRVQAGLVEGEVQVDSAAGSIRASGSSAVAWRRNSIRLDKAAAAAFSFSTSKSEPAPASPSGVFLVTFADLPDGFDGLLQVVNTLTKTMESAQAKTAIVVDPTGRLSTFFTRSRIQAAASQRPRSGVEWIFLRTPEASALARLPTGSAVQVTAKAAPLREESFPLRNVAGLLRGHDPKLRESYVLLTAHYDHIGRRRGAATGGDDINNGANDDASGTSAVLELADTLARLPVRPKRSILFLAVTGEEKGLLGSRAFASNPTVPAAQILANINCEHLGRTDTNQGPHHGKATVTGFEFSTLPGFLVEAGKITGLEVYNYGQMGDDFFRASDNLAFAEKGIPAHTISTAYTFADYHQPGDEWQKIDYPQMELVTRTIGLGALLLADSIEVPRWNAVRKETEAFRRLR